MTRPPRSHAAAILAAALLLAGCADDAGLAPDAAPTDARPNAATVAPTAAAKGPKVKSSITITLDLQPNRAVDVPFVATGVKLRDFVLDDDVNSAVPSTRTFTGLKPGTYTVRTGALPGLTLSQLTCTSTPNGGSGTSNDVVDVARGAVTIQLEASEAVACTFVGSVPLWQEGDLVTRTQLAWDTTTHWFSAYDQVYEPTAGVVEVGLPGASGYSLRFTGPDKVTAFFIQSAPAGALEFDLIDTSSSSSGGFGGQTLALRLNIDLSAAGFMGGTSGAAFGDLRLCDMADASLNGKTITDVITLANTLLGGGSNAYTIGAITDLVTALNNTFPEGTPSNFAQAHLVAGTCP